MSALRLTIRPGCDLPERRAVASAGGAPAVVPVPGFFGTAARGSRLPIPRNERGHTVVTPPLPGFGWELDRLPHAPIGDGPDAPAQAERSLPPEHPVVRAALGSAPTAVRAAPMNPGGLFLAVPYAHLPLPWWYRQALPALSRTPSAPHPYVGVDSADPRVQGALRSWEPAPGLPEPVTPARPESSSFPPALLPEQERLALSAHRAARNVARPVASVRGRDDGTSACAPPRTFPLLAGFRKTPRDRQIVRPTHPVSALAAQLVAQGEA